MIHAVLVAAYRKKEEGDTLEFSWDIVVVMKAARDTRYYIITT